MIPLFLVYFAEYFINQGLVSAASFWLSSVDAISTIAVKYLHLMLRAFHERLFSLRHFPLRSHWLCVVLLLTTAIFVRNSVDNVARAKNLPSGWEWWYFR